MQWLHLLIAEQVVVLPISKDDLNCKSEIVFVALNSCDIADILLEMDRILRPEGAIVIRDEVDVLTKVMTISQGMRWETRLADHESGPFNPEKILVGVKTYWVGSE